MHFRRSLPALVLIVAGCPPSPPSDLPPDAGRTPSSLIWAFNGCREARPGPICEIDADRPLTVWARSSAGILLPPGVTNLKQTAEEAVDGGRKWRFTLTGTQGKIRLIELVHGKKNDVHLEVRPAVTHECPLDLTDLRQAPPPARLASLSRRIADLDLQVRPWCWRTAGISAMASPALTGHVLTWLRRAQTEFQTTQKLQAWAQTRSVEGYVLLQANRDDEGKARLAQPAFTSTLTPGLRLPILNTYGMLSHELGDLASARRALDTALTWSERLDSTTQWMFAARYLMDIRQRLGRQPEAEKIARQLIARAQHVKQPCEAKGALATVHWWSLLLRSQSFQALDRPLPEPPSSVDFAAIRTRIVDQLETCPILRVEVATNLALEALLMHQPHDARKWLDRAQEWTKQRDPTLRIQPWLADANSGWELAMNRPKQALAWLDAQTAAGRPALAWAFWGRRAEAYRRMKAPVQAAQAWGHAQRILEQWPGAIELDHELHGLTANLHRMIQAEVGFLIEQDRVQDAIVAARWARARSLRTARRTDRIEALTPEAKSAWEGHIAAYLQKRAHLDALPPPESDQEAKRRTAESQRLTDEASGALQRARRILWSSAAPEPLATPEDHELFLVIHPGRNTWQVMAQTVDDQRAISAGGLGAQKPQLAQAIQTALTELDLLIDRAKVVRLMPVGRAQRIDLHRLMWRNRPLFVQKPVVYGLDTGIRREANPLKRALIAANPGANTKARNLPHSQKEAQATRQVLSQRGWTVTTKLGERVRRPGLTEALSRIDLFHFAGHATSARAGFSSGLQLADDQYLTVSDVLALPRAPAFVILSACNTGVGAAHREVGPDLGIAQAFILAGASTVVATTRPVDDRFASRVASKLHAQAAYGSIAAARTLGALAADHPDVAAYRVFVP